MGRLIYRPKASALKFHPSNGSRLDKTLLELRKNSRVLRHRRAFADCFGANPVASALGNRSRRDPGAAVRTYHEGLKPTLKTGTFYLAGNRNFLFGSDTLAGLDLYSGRVTPILSDRRASVDFITLLGKLDESYSPPTRIRLLLDNHSAHTSKETQAWLKLH